MLFFSRPLFYFYSQCSFISFIIDDTRHFIHQSNPLWLGQIELVIGWIGLIELGIGLIVLGIGLKELGIGLMELGIGLIELGIGLIQPGPSVTLR